MKKRWYYIVNGLTLYRLVAAPVLIVLIFMGKIDLFKWLLPLSFFTDFIDGFLARKFKVKSVRGAKLDSLGDDLTVVAAIIGLFVLKREFVSEQIAIVIILFVLFVTQLILALKKYHKTSSFHTYSAKVAALLQGLFLIFIFLLPDPLYSLFYAAAIVTACDLIEEIILVFLLPKWEANVKGVYWVLNKKKKSDQ